MSSLPLKLRQLQGPLRRIIRWYLAPSGLLLAAALLVSVAAVVFRQPWLGLGVVALMSIFLPYRLSRQQGVAEDRLMAEVARLRGRHDQSEANIARVATLGADLNVGLAELGEIVRSRGPQIESIATTETEFTKMRLLVTGRLNALDARVDEISDRDAEMGSWSEQLAGLQQEIVEIRERVGDFVESGSMTHAVDGALAREGLSGSTTAAGFQKFDRILTVEDRVELRSWCSTLGLNVSDRALSYIAHEVRVTEDALLGRMAGSLGSAVLRALVLRSVDSRSPHVLEIGSLFGISIAALERSTFGIFDNLTFTAIDPLDGYYKTAELDILTGVPVSQPVFDENMRRGGIDQTRVHLVRHLSTEEAAIQAVEDASVDMLFIDGDHTRYGVECDFRNYVAKVRPTGYVVFDDYQAKDWPDVEEFVDEVVMQRDDLIFIGAGWETAVFRVIAR